jgi:hypothetical protein
MKPDRVASEVQFAMQSFKIMNQHVAAPTWLLLLVCCVAQMAQARLDCDYCDVGRTSLLAMHLLFKLPIIALQGY